MQHEFGFGGLIRIQRIAVWCTVAAGIGFLLLASVALEASNRWGGVGLAAFTFACAFGLQRTLHTMKESAVVLHAEGVRYAHLPESELVLWTSIHQVRERRFLQCLDLIDAEGQTRLRLHYQLVGMAVLKSSVLKHVPIALPRPIRFRRSWGIDALIVIASLLPPVVLIAIDEQRRSPYAVQVTDSEVVLSMLFRTVTIPLHELRLTSKTQNHKGMLIPLLEVEDPSTGKPIIIRNVGVDMIVLKATLEEAVRTRPFAR